MNDILSLLQLSDPALPIGGFSHSAGLETYVQSGVVNNVKTAMDFIRAQLSINIFYTDAAIVSLAYDATENGDPGSLLDLDAECSAVKLPREMREASEKLGLRLLKLFTVLHSDTLVKEYKNAIIQAKAKGHHAVVFGLYACLLRIEKRKALNGFFYNAAAGMVTNSVKLIPLGQADGQYMLFSLQEMLGDLAAGSMTPDRNLLGLCCPGFDIRCMQHENLYSRLYMS